MKTQVQRATVDLNAYPDLVVFYLGMRVNALRGLLTITGLGPQIMAAGEAKPEGLLHCEQNIIYSFFPFQIGMRWYWKDFETMEAWTRSPPHRDWWQKFMKNSGGTGFWHETYCMRGGIEAIYDDLSNANIELSAFAPRVPAKSRNFSSRQRLNLEGITPTPPVGMSENELHANDT